MQDRSEMRERRRGPVIRPEKEEIACKDCGRTFQTEHALKIHRGRSHK